MIPPPHRYFIYAILKIEGWRHVSFISLRFICRIISNLWLVLNETKYERIGIKNTESERGRQTLYI